MAVQTKTIDYADGATALEGYFAWDNAITGPRPGVLIVHAWAGRSPFEEEAARKRAAGSRDARAQTRGARLRGPGDGCLWQGRAG